MLFLLNQEVIDLGVPEEALAACGAGNLQRMPSLSRLTANGQEAAFAAGGIEKAHPNVRLALASLLVMTGRLNCAIFLRPEGARSAHQVAVRFALAPITTMVMLYSAQQQGHLTAAMINRHVWLASAPAPA